VGHISLSDPTDKDPWYKNALELGGYWSLIGEGVNQWETSQLAKLKSEMGKFYKFYTFAEKVDRLNNPNFLGSGSWYGNFLGPGDAGPRKLLEKMGPRDVMDGGAQLHDKGYQAYETAGGGVTMALFSRQVIPADFRLVGAFAKSLVTQDYYHPLGSFIAAGGMLGFAGLGTMKTLGYLSTYQW
jgi:hypothetical protein